MLGIGKMLTIFPIPESTIVNSDCLFSHGFIYISSFLMFLQKNNHDTLQKSNCGNGTRRNYNNYACKILEKYSENINACNKFRQSTKNNSSRNNKPNNNNNNFWKYLIIIAIILYKIFWYYYCLPYTLIIVSGSIILYIVLFKNNR